MASKNHQSFIDKRSTGIILHPTSLPGPGANGELGPEAFHFIDFLHSCGVRVWQVLPLGPTHDDLSPYMTVSAFAGNTRLISLEQLRQWRWLDEAHVQSYLSDASHQHKMDLIAASYALFNTQASVEEQDEFSAFRQHNHFWLEDYCLFQAIRGQYSQGSWAQWPSDLAQRDSEALSNAHQQFAADIDKIAYQQFIFYRQWYAIKQYAHEKGIQLFGDMPIFVAHHSAEVWAYQKYFELDEQGEPVTVAGVPPDYFSETGQRWGNPQYRWKKMKAQGFDWWVERFRNAFDLFDLVRIDHFRGFESYWEIKASEQTAMHGRWVKAPGKQLFNRLLKEFSQLPLIAEDLGVITPEVEVLRDNFNFPGMKILQFAFDGDHLNPYLPHNISPNSVVYTGTHDNDTTLNWFNHLGDHEKSYVYDYLAQSRESMPWLFIRCALASVARLAMLPMQDLLELGEGHRMNTPGESDNNWQWRFQWTQVGDGLAQKLRSLNQLYGRNS